MTPTLADLRALAESSREHGVLVSGDTILALLDRVEKAEAAQESATNAQIAAEAEMYAMRERELQRGIIWFDHVAGKWKTAARTSFAKPEDSTAAFGFAEFAVGLHRREAESTIDRLTAEIAARQEAFDALHTNRDNLAAQVQALRTHHGSSEEVERLTSEAEALRALVPTQCVREEIREAFRTYDANGYTYGHVHVLAWLQRIEAARAAEGGG